MEARPDTRTRLLDATYALMIRKGYPSTSVDEICAAAEVSKGSFYHFFKSKQELGIALLEHHMDGAMQEIEEGLDLSGVDNPTERVIRYVKHVEEKSEDVWSEGCLIGSFALELAETNPEIRAKVSRIFRDLVDELERVFAELCQALRGPDAPPPRELAEQFIMVIEGGVVLSRAHADRRYVPQAIRGFRRYLESLARVHPS
jgi:TetR/AcrR family transcriptional repressor of nem operon